MAQIQLITPNDTHPPALDPSTTTTIFLAGPTNKDWRTPFIRLLESHPLLMTSTGRGGGVTIIDPTQPLWDSTWVQDYSNADDPRFRTQLDWELDHQISADLIVAYFVAGEQAPVSLLELGMALGQSLGQGGGEGTRRNKRVLVGCEEGYCKRGNVQAVCAKYGVSLTENLDDLVKVVIAALEED